MLFFFSPSVPAGRRIETPIESAALDSLTAGPTPTAPPVLSGERLPVAAPRRLHRYSEHATATLEAVDRAPGVAGDGLLREEAGRGDHGEAAVRELLLLHQAELLRVLRLEVERVKAEVAGVVARAERGLGLELLAVELAEAEVDAEGLGGADAARHDGPEPHRQLRDLVNRGAAVGREERVELLLHEEAGRGEHRDAAVGELGLAVAVDLELGLALEEARRVPLAEHVGAAGQAVRELVLLGRGRVAAEREAAELHLHVGGGAEGGAGVGEGLGRGNGEHD